MDNVIQFNGVANANIELDVPTMLRNIADDGGEETIVFMVKNGNLTFHSSIGDVYKLLYYAESFKNYLMNGGFDDE